LTAPKDLDKLKNHTLVFAFGRGDQLSASDKSVTEFLKCGWEASQNKGKGLFSKQ
jgi:hypothetical protein